ncbi:uncharacterized protein LOC106976767 [Acinonyx jubatus]|uniref:Uncharacterized protein LOC106976767 n=1 Tax=Acinonyx jubatus TaxID=32536 RepID=A0ABM3ND59_ACIJB|nr:uncharacterized protein LOC106976767 [Acinonyx jubatus]
MPDLESASEVATDLKAENHENVTLLLGFDHGKVESICLQAACTCKSTICHQWGSPITWTLQRVLAEPCSLHVESSEASVWNAVHREEGEGQIPLGGRLGSALYPSACWKLFVAKEQLFPGALPCLDPQVLSPESETCHFCRKETTYWFSSEEKKLWQRHKDSISVNFGACSHSLLALPLMPITWVSSNMPMKTSTPLREGCMEGWGPESPLQCPQTPPVSSGEGDHQDDAPHCLCGSGLSPICKTGYKCLSQH